MGGKEVHKKRTGIGRYERWKGIGRREGEGREGGGREGKEIKRG